MKRLNYKIRLMQIENSLDYVESFKAFLPDLKKIGSNYRCRSPFQKEKTASFFVNSNKKVWHCFSSGNGGKNIVQFIMKLNDLSFSQALDFVEVRFGLSKKFYSKEVMLRSIENLKLEKKENKNEKVKQVYENNY